MSHRERTWVMVLAGGGGREPARIAERRGRRTGSRPTAGAPGTAIAAENDAVARTLDRSQRANLRGHRPLAAAPLERFARKTARWERHRAAVPAWIRRRNAAGCPLDSR